MGERAAQLWRYRRLAVVGVITWMLFSFTDFFIVYYMELGRLWYFLLLRVCGLIIGVTAALRMHLLPPPSPDTMRLMDMGCSAAASIVVSLMCYDCGGIASPLCTGIATIIVCRTAVAPDCWQRAIYPTSLIVLCHLAVLLIFGTFSARWQGQFGNPAILGIFVLQEFFILGAAALSVAGTHRLWSLRRQVYQDRSVGRYRLKELIGRGGMGEVWVAHHDALQRKVAVKILRPEKVTQETLVRFEREIRATSRLTHPNTVRVYDCGITEDGLCFYVMELVHGQDLASVLHQHGPFRPDQVLRLARQVAGALTEAHRRGIIHRDLKPGNLILTHMGGEQDFLKIVDFGLALVSNKDFQNSVTHTGFIVGTPAYIAPELLSERAADPRSDLYSLGAVMYALLSGQPPFAHQDVRKMLLARMRGEPPPPSSLVAHWIPRELDAAVCRCVRKDPDQRYQSAEDLLRALEAIELNAPQAAGYLSAPAHSPPPYL
jgi:serine/threonine-protein kinase